MKLKFLLLTIFILCSFSYSNDKNKNTHIISLIPEASGISYCKNTDTLVVANDEGKFYEINKFGKIINIYRLGKYDLEGVVCEDDRFIFAVESGSILIVNRRNLSQNLLPIDDLIKIGKKNGIEGIAKVRDDFILSIQSKEKKKAFLITVKPINGKAKIKDIFHSGIIDSSGLDYKYDKLFIVSDKEDRLYIYDLKNKKVMKKIDLPHFAVEGVALDKEGHIFFADDNGAVLKYKLKELSL